MEQYNNYFKEIMQILAVIPARSGSKSLPHKNIKLLNGIPLLAYSIEHAKQSKYDMRIVVSTDSEDYAKIAREYGAEVPFLRPSSISQDNSTDLECMQHCLQFFKISEDYEPDIVVHLRPTQPDRKVEDLDKALDSFIELYGEYDSLRSIIPVEKTPFKMYTIDGIDLNPLFNIVNGIKEPYNMGRQQLPQAYLHNGYIDLIKAQVIRSGSMSGNRILSWKMTKSDNVDIDTQQDFKVAQGGNQ